MEKRMQESAVWILVFMIILKALFTCLPQSATKAPSPFSNMPTDAIIACPEWWDIHGFANALACRYRFTVPRCRSLVVLTVVSTKQCA